MKDTITINYQALDNVRKTLLSYIDTHSRALTHLRETDTFLETQQGDAILALTELSEELKNYLEADIKLLHALRDKIGSSSNQMKALLLPVSSKSTIHVRSSSISEFLETVKTQLDAAYELPSISQSTAEYKEWFSYPKSGGYWKYIQWKYDNEEWNGGLIFQIQTSIRNAYCDDSTLKLGKLQSFYDHETIVPFFNLDDRLATEFDMASLAKRVYESLASDEMEQFLVIQIINMLLTKNEEEAVKMQGMIAEAIVAMGTNASMKKNVIDIPFNMGGAKCNFKVDFKVKTDIPGADQELQYSISKQLSELKFSFDLSNIKVAVSANEINTGCKTENVTFYVNQTALLERKLIGEFIHTTEFTDNFNMSTSLKIEKDYPSDEFRKRMESAAQEVVSGQFMAFSWEKTVESVQENPEVVIVPLVLLTVIAVLCPPTAFVIGPELAGILVAIASVFGRVAIA